MRRSRIFGSPWTFGSLALMAAFAAGCHSNTAVDKGTFKTALENYYNGQKVCLFDETVKFPAQADTNNEDQTKGFDALTDAGMLMRTPEEKKRFLVGSKQVNDYDLSSKGRSMWTPDPGQPGYGNFCFGSPKVTAVDSYTALDSSGDAYTVSYHYDADLPDWVKTDEMMTAFPSIDRVSAPRTATANLAKSSNGWEVQHVSAAL
jgi:hypothetical protein